VPFSVLHWRRRKWPGKRNFHRYGIWWKQGFGLPGLDSKAGVTLESGGRSHDWAISPGAHCLTREFASTLEGHI
jgi:hypothetical protein